MTTRSNLAQVEVREIAEFDKLGFTFAAGDLRSHALAVRSHDRRRESFMAGFMRTGRLFFYLYTTVSVSIAFFLRAVAPVWRSRLFSTYHVIRHDLHF